MMKTGQVEKTNDRQYEVEERRYRTLESASLRLQKEAKGYLDSLRAMTASQMRIAETIDAFYGDSGATDGVSRSYKQAVEDLDAETVKALDGPYRCVPSDLRGLAWDDDKGVEDTKELRQIEWEMNRGGQESFVGEMRLDMNAYGELMDYIYRTTVLEPINRFCAYFPDVNECKWKTSVSRTKHSRRLTGRAGIKKRNHKMLDYDSMRSKVKRLTEKPDKDPAKLPRTEKEQDMVSLTDFLRDGSPSASPSTSPSLRHPSSMSALNVVTNPDLGVPSPPKALNGIRQRLGLTAESPEQDAGSGAGTGIDEEIVAISPSRNKRTARTLLARTSSIMNSYSSVWTVPPGHAATAAAAQHPANRNVYSNHPNANLSNFELQRSTSSISPTKQNKQIHRASSIYSLQSRSTVNSTSTSRDSASTRGATWPRQHPFYGSQSKSTPFFQPSELEDLMAPLKADFMRRQANNLKQAKAAYDQLNEQLMSELPQLIDLRYVIVAFRVDINALL